MEEEDSIRNRIRETQIDRFQKNAISATTYTSIMNKQKARLAKVRQQQIKLRNKRLKIFRAERVLQDLDREQKEVKESIKNMQHAYFVEQSITKADYESQTSMYGERLTQIDNEHLTAEMNTAKKGKTITKSADGIVIRHAKEKTKKNKLVPLKKQKPKKSKQKVGSKKVKAKPKAKPAPKKTARAKKKPVKKKVNKKKVSTAKRSISKKKK